MKINNNESRANELLEVIMAYARLDFNVKAKITNKGDVFDALGSGINMLGEELQSSTVSLKEKEYLLREVHHRVKNNLQIIYSLLNLQSDFIDDKIQSSALLECRNRVKSMSLVHEMLYVSETISRINFKNYTQSLVQHLSFTYTIPNKNVSFNINIPETIYFNIDQMIPLGLMLNEIISNSMKHAFRETGGVVFISISKIENSYQFKIADNGVGINGENLLESKSGFGIQLIKILSEQIESQIEINSANGIEYRFTFNYTTD